MHLTPGQAFAILVPIALGAASPGFAQAPAAGTTGRARETVLTGKERLGQKWTDEQRIDNCKVPLDRRGPKLRPDTCRNATARR